MLSWAWSQTSCNIVIQLRRPADRFYGVVGMETYFNIMVFEAKVARWKELKLVGLETDLRF